MSRDFTTLPPIEGRGSGTTDEQAKIMQAMGAFIEARAILIRRLSGCSPLDCYNRAIQEWNELPTGWVAGNARARADSVTFDVLPRSMDA